MKFIDEADLVRRAGAGERYTQRGGERGAARVIVGEVALVGFELARLRGVERLTEARLAVAVVGNALLEKSGVVAEHERDAVALAEIGDGADPQRGEGEQRRHRHRRVRASAALLQRHLNLLQIGRAEHRIGDPGVAVTGKIAAADVDDGRGRIGRAGDERRQQPIQAAAVAFGQADVGEGEAEAFGEQ